MNFAVIECSHCEHTKSLLHALEDVDRLVDTVNVVKSQGEPVHHVSGEGTEGQALGLHISAYTATGVVSVVGPTVQDLAQL